MTDYKTLFGKKIKFLTSDLTMSTATEGELFYSNTDKEFKIGVNVLAWSAGGNLTAVKTQIRGTGTLTAGLVAGGFDSPAALTTVEEYDGSRWSEVTDMPEAKRENY